VVSLENTLSGTILPLKDAKEISDFVRSLPVPVDQKPIAMHLDGARLFDAVAAEGVDLKEYCACFDSISFCLAKGVGAPMGSVIVGNKRFIERAKWYRKMFGGGTRQVYSSISTPWSLRERN
jgi:threonine aldolase